MSEVDNYYNHPYFILSLKEGEIHTQDNPQIDPSFGLKKTQVTKLFAAWVEKVQNLTPRISIRDLTLCVDDVYIIEIYFYNINACDEKDLKHFQKMYDSYEQCRAGIENDLNGLPDTVPISQRFIRPDN